MAKPALFWEDEEGNQLGSDDHIPAIPLYVGMIVTIHGHSGEYRVTSWRYHHGHPDEGYGLHVCLTEEAT